MTSIDDMKELISEWMGQAVDAIGVAKTYAELRLELDRQLECCMSDLTQRGDNR